MSLDDAIVPGIPNAGAKALGRHAQADAHHSNHEDEAHGVDAHEENHKAQKNDHLAHGVGEAPVAVRDGTLSLLQVANLSIQQQDARNEILREPPLVAQRAVPGLRRKLRG